MDHARRRLFAVDLKGERSRHEIKRAAFSLVARATAFGLPDAPAALFRDADLSVRLTAQECRDFELLVPLVIREQIVGIVARQILRLKLRS